MKYAIPATVFVDFGDGVRLEDGDEIADRLRADVLGAINAESGVIENRLANGYTRTSEGGRPWHVAIRVRDANTDAAPALDPSDPPPFVEHIDGGGTDGR